jgi:OmpA-OmpF porin, OOP family
MNHRIWTLLTGSLVLLITSAGRAQELPNLVPNPSFEQFDSRPTEISQLYLARPWKSLAVSGNEPAELFTGGALARVSVPTNFNGTEPAHSGTAYAGFIPFSKMEDEQYREFFITTLQEPLEAGCTYRAACFVSLAERAHWAADGIQILLSARAPLLAQRGYTLAQPQVSAPQVITQTEGWVEVSGMFRASGGERMLTIGNFQLSEDTDVRRRLAKGKDKEAGDIAYYYLDDVSVVKVMDADGSPARLAMPPPLAPLPAAPKVGEAVRLENIYFASDEAKLLPESAPSLNQLAALLQANPQWRIILSGHTDNTDTPLHNMLLSHERAEAVRQYLIGKGIAPGRLTAQGFGDTKPVANNATTAGREQNRRVEFTLQ